MLKVLVAGALAGLIVKAIVVGSYLTRRWWRRRALRKELRLMHGDRRPLFTTYGELEERRRTKPPIRSLRNRGDDNAA